MESLWPKRHCERIKLDTNFNRKSNVCGEVALGSFHRLGYHITFPKIPVMTSDSVVVVVNVLASITALYMCLSPAPTMARIYKLKCTGHMPVLPIVAQWTYNHIWMLYGYLTDEYFPLFAIYAVGNLLSVTFLAIFFYGSTQERKVFVAQLIGLALLFNLATACYAFLGPQAQRPSQVIQTIGFLAIACGLALYASPFATIRLVVRTKNSISIPIGMVLVGTISNATWIVYGALVDDLFIVCPTVVNTGLCVVQLVLYVVYRPGRRRKQVRRLDHSSESLSDSTYPDSGSCNSRSEHDITFAILETPRHADSVFATTAHGTASHV